MGNFWEVFKRIRAAKDEDKPSFGEFLFLPQVLILICIFWFSTFVLTFIFADDIWAFVVYFGFVIFVCACGHGLWKEAHEDGGGSGWAETWADSDDPKRKENDE